MNNRLLYILENCQAYGFTAYAIAKDTGLSAVGIQKILDGNTKNPNRNTIELLYNWVKNKLEEIQAQENNPGNTLENTDSHNLLENQVIPALDKIMEVLLDIGLEVDEIKEYIKRNRSANN